jgi:geranylgeranyl diphosphate synthase, type II
MPRLSPAVGKWEQSILSAPIPDETKDTIPGELREAFRSRLQLSSYLEPNLAGALRYLLDHCGSMARPRIVYRLATAYGIDRDRALDLAVALEYFHTASLVFDDLPCMDNAAMRRGAPCVHVRYGESVAMLAALALINRAYSLMWRATDSCSTKLQRKALIYLELRLGVQGLLNGQSMDLNYSALPHTRASAEKVAQGKTVSLISLTLVLPAIVGGAPPRQQKLLERISECWGLVYQITDDLKDVLNSASFSGKTAGRDELLGRPNTVLAVGVPAAAERVGRLMHTGDRTLKSLLLVNPGLDFLNDFRSGLKENLDRVIVATGVIPIDRKR